MEEYETLKPKMFAPKLVSKCDGFNILRRVCILAHNGQGKIGIVVAKDLRCCAVHEINRDGNFSKKGPYWTKKDWIIHSPRRYALCDFAASTLGTGMKAPGRVVTSYGLHVVEIDTVFLPMMSFEDWKFSYGKF